MRLAKTVNSPTQPRPGRRKQGRDGVNNKAEAPIFTELPTVATMTRHPPFFFLRTSPLHLLPRSPPSSTLPTRQSTACCLGNNTKRFFSTATSPRQHLAFLQAVVGSARPGSFDSGPDAQSDHSDCVRLLPAGPNSDPEGQSQ